MSEDSKYRETPTYAFLKEWWTIIAPIAASVASVLIAVGVDEPLSRALGFPLALILAGITAYLLHRKNRQAKVMQEAEQRRLGFSERPPKSAFRGLYSYGREDSLPGEHRRREALTIATQVESAEFAFGVVSGEIGTGKTSLLQSGVHAILERHGATVRFIRHPRELLELARSGTTGTGWDNRLRTALDELAVRDGGVHPPDVLIIDQFEEFFVELENPSARLELGEFLRSPSSARAVKVLCAVRSDHLLGMHNLAPALPEPLSTKALHPIYNFEESQAAEVIEECARLDRLPLSPHLAETIAADLALGGPVRPPELQLVCEALGNSLTLEHYRAAGGARGILSEHVKKAVAVCPDPALGRLLLRALCDFEMSPPIKAQPQNIHKLTGTIGASEASSSTLLKIQDCLKQFQIDRLVVASRDERDELIFSLVHDYLVGPIGAATSELPTRTEQANQALRLYLAERQADPRATIPLRRYNFIKQYAAPILLGTLPARQIMHASRRAYLGAASTLVLLLSTVTATLLIALNTRPEVTQEIVGRHFAEGVAINELPVALSQTGVSIITGPTYETEFSQFTDSVTKFWHPMYGDSLAVVKRLSGISFNARFALVRSSPNDLYEVYEIATGHRQPIRISKTATRVVALSNIDSVLVVFDVDTIGSTPLRAGMWTGNLQLWTLSSHLIASLPDALLRMPYVAAEGRRIVFRTNKDGIIKPMLWRADAPANSISYLVVDSAAWIGSTPDVSERRNRIITCEVTAHNVTVHLWDLESGAHIQSRSIAAPGSNGCTATFNDSGTVALLRVPYRRSSSGSDSTTFYALDIPDLMLMDRFPPVGVTLIPVETETSSNQKSPRFAWVNQAGAVMLWNSTSSTTQPIVLRDLTAGDVGLDSLLLDPTGKFLLVQYRSGGYRVWNAITGDTIVTIRSEPAYRYVGFSVEGDVLHTTTDANLVSLYDLRTGEKIVWFNDVFVSRGNILSYNRECEQVHVWTNQGMVFRYVRGWHIPAWGFRPARRCVHSRESSPRL